MKVFLGGTVNGSSWRNYIIPRLNIAYFNPVVVNWTEDDLERELYERRHCDFCLYVITPKQTGFYALAEVIDDSIKRPDRTIYCFLTEDGGDRFNQYDVEQLRQVERVARKNGAYCFDTLDEVIELLNNEQPQKVFLNQKLLEVQHDVYLSYGRHDSAQLTQRIGDKLKEEGFSIWYDDAPIPSEIEFLTNINQIIRQAHVFVFVISQHALNSEYCRRELEYVIALGKLVIFVDAGLVDKSHPLLQQHQQRLFVDINELDLMLEYIKQQLPLLTGHTRWLGLSQQWIEHKKDPDWLAYGKTRREAQRWLNASTLQKCPYQVPSMIRHFIKNSVAQKFSDRCMYHFNQWVKPVVYHARFDDFIGATAVANPLALLPQLWVLFMASSSEAISVFMWLIFLMLQLSTTLFAVKHRNFGLCLSQFASMMITCSIIVIALLKR